MPQTYPAPPPTVSGDVITIHRFLQSPTLIQRRLRTLAEQRFIADALLTAKLPAAGGAVWFEQGESIYTLDEPEVVAPGGEYPLTSTGDGTTQVAATSKWGQDAEITDEAIKRNLRNPVDRGLLKLVNQMVRKVDRLALAAITSQVEATSKARATWVGAAKASQIFLDVAEAKARIIDSGEGFVPDTVVLPSTVYAHVLAAFADAGFLPRESAATPLLTGDFPTIDGMRWLSSPHTPSATAALVLDSTQLGGMGDEDLGGPGYAGNLGGVESKVIRNDDRELYKVRARRVTVPVVQEPAAAHFITSVAA